MQLSSCREPNFIKVERNLENLGFFTPSNNALKRQREKVVRLKRVVDGETRELSITIVPSSKYGLPNTLHQDMYRAFQRILTERIRQYGNLPRRIEFSTVELLECMGKEERASRNGQSFEQVRDWLKVMHATVIETEGCVWRADRKEWVSDSVHVFERVVLRGSQLENGQVAEKHQVWLSEWQHANINEHYLLSINYDLYKGLQRNIGKSLFSLLHSWFFVGKGEYAKEYGELCQWLGLKRHKRLSYMKRQLDPSHEELKQKGFLEKWEYERRGRGDLWVRWFAGEKYFEDKRRLEALRTGKYKELIEANAVEVVDKPQREARELVGYFQELVGRKRKPTAAEAGKAAELIEQHGHEAARFVVEYAVEQSKKTGFQMQNFGAVTKLYTEGGLAQYGEGKVARQKEEEQIRARAGAAIELVRYLHRKLGRADCQPTDRELEQAREFTERMDLVAAKSFVSGVIKDAVKLKVELREFGDINRVMDRVMTS